MNNSIARATWLKIAQLTSIVLALLSVVLFTQGVHAKMSKKILVVLTSHDQLGTTGKKTGAYLSEITHPYEVFTKAGYTVEFVSPKGGAAPLDGVDLKDALNKKWMEDRHFSKAIKSTKKPSEINPKNYKAVFYAGGHGTMFDLPQDERLAQISSQVYEAGGVVGAVCHGPAGLVNIKLSNGKYLVAGKTVSAFTNEEEEAVGLTQQMPFLLESKLIERGAIHKKSPNFKPHVEISERLVTGQNPASATGVAEGMIKLLK